MLLALDMPSLEWWEIVLRLGVAAVLAAALGIERGVTGHEAGLRTHVLVALGSALFAVASVGAFDAFVGPRSDTNVNVDVTRIAAYVAPGVGFIGAGVILKRVREHEQPTVLGLTTAASLWAVAAIGVASGLGFWVGAVMATAIGLIVLVVARPISAAMEARSRARLPVPVRLEIELAEGSPVDAVLTVVASFGELARMSLPGPEEPDPRRVHIHVLTPATSDVHVLLDHLATTAGVRRVDADLDR